MKLTCTKRQKSDKCFWRKWTMRELWLSKTLAKEKTRQCAFCAKALCNKLNVCKFKNVSRENNFTKISVFLQNEKNRNDKFNRWLKKCYHTRYLASIYPTYSYILYYASACIHSQCKSANTMNHWKDAWTINIAHPYSILSN